MVGSSSGLRTRCSKAAPPSSVRCPLSAALFSRILLCARHSEMGTPCRANEQSADSAANSVESIAVGRERKLCSPQTQPDRRIAIHHRILPRLYVVLIDRLTSGARLVKVRSARALRTSTPLCCLCACFSRLQDTTAGELSGRQRSPGNAEAMQPFPLQKDIRFAPAVDSDSATDLPKVATRVFIARLSGDGQYQSAGCRCPQ